MVKETRIVFGVQDLVSFRVVCEECGGEAAFSFSADLPNAPDRCPWCNHFWQVGQVNRLLGIIRTMLHNHSLTGLRLELDGEAAAESDGGKA